MGKALFVRKRCCRVSMVEPEYSKAQGEKYLALLEKVRNLKAKCQEINTKGLEEFRKFQRKMRARDIWRFLIFCLPGVAAVLIFVYAIVHISSLPTWKYFLYIGGSFVGVISVWVGLGRIFGLEKKDPAEFIEERYPEVKKTPDLVIFKFPEEASINSAVYSGLAQNYWNYSFTCSCGHTNRFWEKSLEKEEKLMAKMINAEDLVGLDFQSDQDLLTALQIAYEQKLYRELPGGNSLIILRQDFDGLVPKPKEKEITFSEVKVVSAGDLSVQDFIREKRNKKIRGVLPH